VALQRIDGFDQAYFQTVIGACFQAIVRTTLDGESERLRPTEIRAALAHVMGMVAATTDARAAQDPRALAEQLAAEFLDSFRTTRESLDANGAVAEPREARAAA
jgi:hypothetical protein